MPAWDAAVRFSDLSAALPLGAGEGTKEASLAGGAGLLRLRGFGPHFDIPPFFLRFDEAGFDRYRLERGVLSFRADDPTRLLLTEGSAGFCGGRVRVYALHLDLASLDAGFTLLLDNLDAGRVLALFPQVRGTATGTLHGKLPLAVRGGKQVRLRDAFLYSPPGQVGRLELEEAHVLVDKLRETGLPDETCASLEKALGNLDYEVLRLDLTQNRDGQGLLAVRLDGSASEGKKKTPVNLRLNFNGQLEEMINVGLQAAGLSKGTAP